MGYTNTGGRYNPVTDSWTATNTVGAPSGRAVREVVWTGSEMIIIPSGPKYSTTNPSTHGLRAEKILAKGEQNIESTIKNIPEHDGQIMTIALFCYDFSTGLKRKCLTQRRIWLGAESNRRHVDFQSTALPTELPSRKIVPGIGCRNRHLSRKRPTLNIQRPMFNSERIARSLRVVSF